MARSTGSPSCEVVTVETGASWLAWIMTQADAIYEDHSMCAQPKLSLKPSELIRRQCAATFMYDPVAINNRAITGVETLMWGNDYPHPEGTWPDSQAVNGDQFDGVSQEDLDAIVHGNAARSSASTSTSSRSSSPSPRDPRLWRGTSWISRTSHAETLKARR